MTESDETSPPPSQHRVKKKRGFAAMPREHVKQIAQRGGLAAQASGRAHVWTPEEAKAAGRKGGSASARKRNRDAKESAA